VTADYLDTVRGGYQNVIVMCVWYGDYIKEDEMGGTYGTHGGVRNTCLVVVLKSELIA
jgi:hypothetical protein